MARPDLPDWPAGLPRRPAGITEAELFQGYSGLADRRESRRPDPIPTPETVRANLRAAVDEDPRLRPTSRERTAS